TDPAHAPGRRPGVRAGGGARGLDGLARGGLLEALHAHRLPRRAVPAAVRPAALPVPPVDVRRPALGEARVRTGGPAAAPAPARARRRGLPDRNRGLLRPRRPGVLGPGEVTA